VTETETLVVDMLQMGRCKDVIVGEARKAGWSTHDVVTAARDHGYEFDADGCPRSTARTKAARPRADLTPEAIAPKPAVVIPHTPAAPAAPAAAQQDQQSTADQASHLVGALIRGLNSPTARIRGKAAKVLALCEELLQLLAEQEAADRAERESAAELTRKRAEVARLEQQLRDAKAALRTGGGSGDVCLG
jgi:hypothetical protein